MRFQGLGRGLKTSSWNPNEIVASEDISFVGISAYQNLVDLLIVLAEQGKATGSTPDLVLGGLLLEWTSGMNCSLRAGVAGSFSGSYYNSDVWGFFASAGDAFAALVGADTQVTFDVGDGSNPRVDLVQVRPTLVGYSQKSRNYKDPITRVITSALTFTRKEFGVEVAILKGSPTGSPVAVAHTAGWIKVAEAFIPQSASSINQGNIKDVRDSAIWTTEVGSTKYSLIHDFGIDWGTALGQVSAVDVPIADVGGFYPTKNVEAALQGLYLQGLGVLILSAGSPYTFVSRSASTVLIGATTNPYVFNLPAATGSGDKLRIVNISSLATGLVRIHPYTGDAIGSAGANVDCYLQNVDQSGNPYLFQFIELVDSASGTWAVTGGQYCPHQSVDTDGQQYHLGKLHHFPLGNTTDRKIYDAAPVAGWSGAITGTGVVGVPTGAKGIKARVELVAYATAAAACSIRAGFSDNNSNVPTMTTSHPIAQVHGYGAIAGRTEGLTELDVPLNASGQFYFNIFSSTNTTLASDQIIISIVGWWDGT
jgi:hypothetical protein